VKNLLTQLREIGLSPAQIDCTLTTIENWLDEKYPVLARMYQAEIMNKIYSEADVHLDPEVSRSKVA
jgi:hypothetical protein